jgi:Ni,Fe-hydrogenase III small subunit
MLETRIASIREAPATAASSRFMRSTALSRASRGRVSNIIPVDVAAPGCLPRLLSIMQGILTAIVR